jgi:hypothetical protein
MVDASEIDLRNGRATIAANRRHRPDRAGQENAPARIRLPFGQSRAGLVNVREHDLHRLGHGHAIELLFPLTRADLRVHQHNELDSQWSSPSNDHLAMDQAVIDAIKYDGH